MWLRGIVGIVLCVIGAIWILQGTNIIHGSGMSGEGQWGVIGVIVALLGLGLLVWAGRLFKRGAGEPS